MDEEFLVRARSAPKHYDPRWGTEYTDEHGMKWEWNGAAYTPQPYPRGDWSLETTRAAFQPGQVLYERVLVPWNERRWTNDGNGDVSRVVGVAGQRVVVSAVDTVVMSLWTAGGVALLGGTRGAGTTGSMLLLAKRWTEHGQALWAGIEEVQKAANWAPSKRWPKATHLRSPFGGRQVIPTSLRRRSPEGSARRSALDFGGGRAMARLDNRHRTGGVATQHSQSYKTYLEETATLRQRTLAKAKARARAQARALHSGSWLTHSIGANSLFGRHTAAPRFVRNTKTYKAPRIGAEKKRKMAGAGR